MMKSKQRKKCSKNLESVAVDSAYGLLSPEEEDRFMNHLDQEQCDACGEIMDEAVKVADFIEKNEDRLRQDLFQKDKQTSFWGWLQQQRKQPIKIVASVSGILLSSSPAHPVPAKQPSPKR